MPDPAGHAAHDQLLVAAHAAGDASGAGLARAAALVATCPECARLHRDLRALSAALASAPAPARPRDFGVTPEQAAALRRPRGWRRLLAPLAGARSAAGPLAASLAALGVAGLLLGGGLRLPLGGAGSTAADTAAPSQAIVAMAGAATPTVPPQASIDLSLATPPPSAADATPTAPNIGPHPVGTSAPVGSRRIAIDRSDAIAIARAARPDYAKEDVLAARLGTFDELGNQYATIAGPTPSPSDAVWLVDLGWVLGPLDGQGVYVVIDAADGHVIQVIDWIS